MIRSARFASKTAAIAEPFADASIVNITGSNSVNVFLGLGLPWAIAAIYWAGQVRKLRSQPLPTRPKRRLIPP